MFEYQIKARETYGSPVLEWVVQADNAIGAIWCLKGYWNTRRRGYALNYIVSVKRLYK